MSKEFWLEVANLIKPIPELKLEYRLYYDEAGNITSCSMQNHAPGNYLVVTREEYELYFNYKVANGKLTKIENDSGYCVQLKQSTKGHRVVKGHANLVLEDGEVYNDIEFYDYRNN